MRLNNFNCSMKQPKLFMKILFQNLWNIIWILFQAWKVKIWMKKMMRDKYQIKVQTNLILKKAKEKEKEEKPAKTLMKSDLFYVY